jgi:hypothetical protein
MLCFRTPWAMAAMALHVLLACGARSSLREDGASDSPGGSPGIGGGPGVGGQPSGGSGPGGSPPCGRLEIEGEPYRISANQNATAPEVGLTGDGTLFVAWLAQDGTLVGDGSLTPPLPWPDPFDAITVLAPSATGFATGARPGAAVAFYRSAASDWFLQRDLWGGGPAELVFNGAGEPLIAAAAETFSVVGWAESALVNLATLGDSGVLAPFTSLCLEKRPPLAAISRGSEVLTATADSLSGSSCFAQVPQQGNAIRVYRALADQPLPFETDLVEENEPILHLELAPASFGAWLVYQTDGSLSEVMPPIQLYRLDAQGVRIEESPIQLTGSDLSTITVAIAAVGENLAFAYVDSLDPSAPVVLIQLHGPDGALLQSTSFPTNPAWLTGRLRMTATPDGSSLLLAWTADVDKSVGVAKIRCLP